MSRAPLVPTALALPLALLGIGCTPSPDAAQCQAMVEHLIELTRDAHDGRAATIAATVTREHADSLRERCLEGGTRREVECVLATTSLDEIPSCAP